MFYGNWRKGQPVMLVHAATAPSPQHSPLPLLPDSEWVPTYEAAWTLAALASAYRTGTDTPAAPLSGRPEGARTGDGEHASKFGEVARESHAGANQAALGALAAAGRWLAGEG